MVVYKVVRKVGDHYKSAIITNNAALDYSINKKTEAKFGLIFVFLDLHEARYFSRRNEINSIMECETTDKPEPIKLIDHPNTNARSLRKWWTLGRPITYFTLAPPQGTYGVSSLTPFGITP